MEYRTCLPCPGLPVEMSDVAGDAARTRATAIAIDLSLLVWACGLLGAGAIALEMSAPIALWHAGSLP
jgi:hypothetical protein